MKEILAYSYQNLLVKVPLMLDWYKINCFLKEKNILFSIFHQSKENSCLINLLVFNLLIYHSLYLLLGYNFLGNF